MYSVEMVEALALAEKLELVPLTEEMSNEIAHEDELVEGWDGKVWYFTNGTTTILLDREALSIRHGQMLAHATRFSECELEEKERILARILLVRAQPEFWLE